MTHPNSAEAFHHLQSTGKINAGHELAMRMIARYGPGTSGEIIAEATRQGYTVPGLWKRFSELKQLGLIEEIEDRRCAVSGRTAAVLKACGKPVQGELFG